MKNTKLLMIGNGWVAKRRSKKKKNGKRGGRLEKNP